MTPDDASTSDSRRSRDSGAERSGCRSVMSRWQTFRRLMRHCAPVPAQARSSRSSPRPASPSRCRRSRCSSDRAIDDAIPNKRLRAARHPRSARCSASRVLKAVLHGVRRQIAGELSIGVEADLREKLYNHVQALDVGYHERISTGQIMSRATSDIQRDPSVPDERRVVAHARRPDHRHLRDHVRSEPAARRRSSSRPRADPRLVHVPVRGPVRPDRVGACSSASASSSSVVEETVVGIRVVKAFGQRDAAGRKAREGRRPRLRRGDGIGQAPRASSSRSSTSSRSSD